MHQGLSPAEHRANVSSRGAFLKRSPSGLSLASAGKPGHVHLRGWKRYFSAWTNLVATEPETESRKLSSVERPPISNAVNITDKYTILNRYEKPSGPSRVTPSP